MLALSPRPPADAYRRSAEVEEGDEGEVRVPAYYYRHTMAGGSSPPAPKFFTPPPQVELNEHRGVDETHKEEKRKEEARGEEQNASGVEQKDEREDISRRDRKEKRERKKRKEKEEEKQRKKRDRKAEDEEEKARRKAQEEEEEDMRVLLAASHLQGETRHQTAFAFRGTKEGKKAMKKQEKAEKKSKRQVKAERREEKKDKKQRKLDKELRKRREKEERRLSRGHARALSDGAPHDVLVAAASCSSSSSSSSSGTSTSGLSSSASTSSVCSTSGESKKKQKKGWRQTWRMSNLVCFGRAASMSDTDFANNSAMSTSTSSMATTNRGRKGKNENDNAASSAPCPRRSALERKGKERVPHHHHHQGDEGEDQHEHHHHEEDDDPDKKSGPGKVLEEGTVEPCGEDQEDEGWSEEAVEWCGMRYAKGDLPPFDTSGLRGKTAYNPNHCLWLSTAAALAYRSPAQIRHVVTKIWEWDGMEFFHDAETDTQGFGMYAKNRCIIICFRGTESSRDWSTNLKIAETDPFTALPAVKVHSGFNQAVLSVLEQIVNFIDAALAFDPSLPLYITGHSLGGALANLCLAYFTFPGSPFRLKRMRGGRGGGDDDDGIESESSPGSCGGSRRKLALDVEEEEEEEGEGGGTSSSSTADVDGDDDDRQPRPEDVGETESDNNNDKKKKKKKMKKEEKQKKKKKKKGKKDKDKEEEEKEVEEEEEEEEDGRRKEERPQEGNEERKLQAHPGHKHDPFIKGVYTFGQPKVGNEALAYELRVHGWGRGTVFFRLTNNNDLVPFVPRRVYCHCGTRIFLSGSGYMVQGDEAARPAREFWRETNAGRVFKRKRKAFRDHLIKSYVSFVRAHYELNEAILLSPLRKDMPLLRFHDAERAQLSCGEMRQLVSFDSVIEGLKHMTVSDLIDTRSLALTAKQRKKEAQTTGRRWLRERLGDKLHDNEDQQIGRVYRLLKGELDKVKAAKHARSPPASSAPASCSPAGGEGEEPEETDADKKKKKRKKESSLTSAQKSNTLSVQKSSTLGAIFASFSSLKGVHRAAPAGERTKRSPNPLGMSAPPASSAARQ